MTKKFLRFTFIFLIMAIFSCSHDDKNPNAETAYTKAFKLLKNKDYSEAGKAFEKIDDDFPFSKWSVKAQTMAVFAFYKNDDYADVVRVVDDFIRINPTSEYIPYMLYMKALSYYAQIPPIDRAQDNTKLAFATFRELLARFPISEYSDDVNAKLIVVNEHLAGAKMAVGRYQMSQKNYVGAIKNFQEVSQRFAFTNQGPEAFYRLTELYYKIGMKNEAYKAYKQLSIRFQDNGWAKKAQKIVER